MRISHAFPIENRITSALCQTAASGVHFPGGRIGQSQKDDLCKGFIHYSESSLSVRRLGCRTRIPGLQTKGSSCPPYAFTRLQKNWGLITSNYWRSAEKQVSQARAPR